MKALTKYVADDGTEFTTETKCAEYEALCAEIAGVMAALPALPKDDGCNFANGHGYIQHDRETFLRVRRELLLIAKRVCPHRWIDESLTDQSIHPSWAGRIISDSSRPLDRAWYRVYCTDLAFREWGQPYYAENPNKAPEQFALNAPRADGAKS